MVDSPGSSTPFNVEIRVAAFAHDSEHDTATNTEEAA